MSEIEEFLRRAAAMRAQQAQQARQPPQRTRPSAARPVVPTDQVIDAEVIEADEVSGDDVARDVERHLDTSRFQRRASKLAESVRNADEAIEAHLHQAFEHRLGQLGASTSAAEDSILDAEETAAAAMKQAAASQFDFQAMLRDPQNIRNAIIMNELLKPASERW